MTGLHIPKARPAILVACLLLLAGLVVAPRLSALSSGAIAQGFQADAGRGDIVPGALVSFKAGSHSVELAATDTTDRLAGVAGQSPLVVISGSDKEVQIILGGTTNALVSDINGNIRAGDKITASPIAGVGMLAPIGSRIVGTAKSNFDTQGAQTQTITDTHGKQHSVHVGFVPLQIGLAYYQTPGGSDFLPPFIQNFANSIAGKQVSLVRILFCTILLLLSFISLSILIYSAVRSAMVSLGRNPLASSEIRKSLYQVGVVTIVVWGGALLASYLILTL